MQQKAPSIIRHPAFVNFLMLLRFD